MPFILRPSPEEQWRDVVGYEGLYLVSDFGRVKSIGYLRPGLIRRSYCTPGRYPMVNLWRDGVQSNYTVHALVDRAFNGPMPEGLELNHKDGVKQNGALSNLERVTRSENTLHAFSLGLKTGRKGMEHGRSVLTDEEVLAMREQAGSPNQRGRFRQGVIKELAAAYGVTRQCVGLALHGKTWKHL